MARDTPLDAAIGRIPTSAGEPVLGTIPNYCSAFLQRLADPTAPYDAVTNPYRTVDWLTIDLTVFSGEDRESNISGAGTYTRRSRQRNGHIKQIGSGTTTAANSLYSYETDFGSQRDAQWRRAGVLPVSVRGGQHSPRVVVELSQHGVGQCQSDVQRLCRQYRKSRFAAIGQRDRHGSQPAANTLRGSSLAEPTVRFALRVDDGAGLLPRLGCSRSSRSIQRPIPPSIRRPPTRRRRRSSMPRFDIC